MNRRLLRAIASITLCVAVMGLAAYGFSRVTRTGWVWWLAPLTVALDGSLLFRARARRSAAVLSLSELSVFGDLGVPLYLVSSAVAAGVAAWGAYSGNVLVLIIGAACAILGTAFERPEDPAFERTTRRHDHPSSSMLTHTVISQSPTGDHYENSSTRRHRDGTAHRRRLRG